MGSSSSSNKLFTELYGGIQARLYQMNLSAEEKIMYMYQDAYDAIIKDIVEVYGKYSQNGKLSYAQMSKYNRLKNLEKQVAQQLAPQLRKKDAFLKQFTSIMYEESFYQHAYAIDQDGGCALKWGLLREEDIEAISLSPLSKLSDSAFLKGDRDQAVFAIRKVIAVGLVRGDGYPEMSRSIRDAMGLIELKNGMMKSAEKGQLYKALRIARTEGQRAAVEGQQRAYQKAAEDGVDLEEVWDAALDGRTRPEHGALDGQVKQEEGWYVPSIGWVPAPIQSGVASFDIHCRCRIRGQIKGYPPTVRGVKGGGQQPWTDYDTWKGVVKEKGSAKSLNLPPRIDEIPIGTSGAVDFGKRLKPVDAHVGGSTGAKVYVDDEGQQWIVKTYGGSSPKVKNEFVANQLYKKAGVQVADTRLAMVGDDLAIASKRLSSEYSVVGRRSLDSAAAASRVKSGFVTDAWLANWDVAGLDIDNLMWVEGKISSITRIDHGGALFYRAQGAKKGSAFGNTVTELKTLRDKHMNPASAGLFKNVSDEDIAKQIRTLRTRLKKSDLHDILSYSGMHSELAKEYYDILAARLDYLNSWEKNHRKSLLTKTTTPEPILIGKSPSEVTQMVPKAWETFVGKERDAIRQYTGSGYRTINRRALSGNYYKELDDAIDKLPFYEGYVGRGMSGIEDIQSMFEKWKSGEWAHVKWKAYSSTSITPGKNFDTSGGYLAVIKTEGKNRAGYIDGKSSISSEDEYLFAPNAQFRVIGYAESPSGRQRTLLLEEMVEHVESQDPPKRMEYEEIMKYWRNSRAR